MSVFRPRKLVCPACKGPVDFQTVFSVNADRRSDLRDAIIDGSFQRETCPKCGRAFRLEPEFIYFNLDRRQWILVRPFGAREQFADLERQARALYDTAFGDNAPPDLREETAAIRPRVVFGWAALREKLVCAQAGLDDAVLELVKLATIRGLDNTPFRDDTELRLVGVEGEELVLAWIRAVPEDLVETLRVPRELYDGIAADAEGWGALRAELDANYFVDLSRLLSETETGEGETGAAESEDEEESPAKKTARKAAPKKAASKPKPARPAAKRGR